MTQPEFLPLADHQAYSPLGIGFQQVGYSEASLLDWFAEPVLC